MEKIKTVYRENIFIKWKELSDKKYMISFYIDIDEVDKNITVKVIDDYDYQDLYQHYDEVFNTYKWYKECKELHDLITKHINLIDELPWYNLWYINMYQDKVTVYTWY